MQAETAPLQGEEEFRYGTGEGGAGRSVTRRKGRVSGKCLLVTSSIATLLLVGSLIEVQRRPAASGAAGAHSTADAVARLFSSAKGQKLSLTAAELQAFPPDVLSALNVTADPCEDFYDFSCGTWNAETTIPAWQSSWAKQWDGVNTEVETKAVKSLAADTGPGGTFYRSCMDTKTIQTLGAKPLMPWFDAVELIRDHATLMQALARFAIADMNMFFSWWVDADSEDSSINSFFIAQGGITMPDRSYYIDATSDMARHRQSYTTMIVNIMTLAGRTPAEAATDAANVMEVETAVAKAMATNTEERDAHGSRASPEELSRIVPSLDWKGWFAMVGVPNVGTKEGGFLLIKNREFLAKLDGIIKTVGLDRIRSYMRWQAAYNYAPYLSFPFEDELVRYNKDLFGISHLPPRWRKCFFSTGDSMDMIVSKLFVDNYFPETARLGALEMLEEIRTHFKAALETKAWMDPPTRVKAVAKLEKMFLEVGHPTVWPKSASETFKEFGGLHVETYFDNIVATNAFDVQNTLARLGKAVDRRRWGSSSATDVNSYYSRKVNGIFIPAGILQPPFYSPTQAVARNYGSSGAICGHEMTHGFDDIGREYDADGNRNGWWTPAVIEGFKERASCISTLFSSFKLDGKHVNGNLTLGEAIADAGGLKMSWEAFLEKAKPDADAKRLFFIAMGQTWCQREKKVAARAELLTDPHPPAKFRVMGTLSQFAPFAETFSCPVGSKMNPAERCHLW